MTERSKDVAPEKRASDAVIARLHSLHPKLIDLSLERLYRLLERLGNPQTDLPPVIHVAGTNGKGSVSATIRAVAEAAGHRVHTYTSPHLVRFHERIRIAGRLIEEDALNALLEEVEQAVAGEPITFFEVTTAAALLAFSRADADLCILEVGLGGRLDATNVVDKPLMCAITPVSYDHKEFLGDSLGEIAGEKAGILKTGCPAVIAPQAAEADQAIRERGELVGADLMRFGPNWRALAPLGESVFHYEDDHGSMTLPLPALPGSHQVVNAATAIAALRYQNTLHIPEAAYSAGLGWVRWPARLQRLTGSSLADKLPEGSTLFLDGGHNPHAAEILRAFLKDFDPVEEPITLILGMMQRKDPRAFLKPLANLGANVIALPIPGHEDGAAPAADLAAAASDVGMRGRMAKDIWSAVDMVTAGYKAGTRPVVLIGGSLYLAGHVLEEIRWFPT